MKNTLNTNRGIFYGWWIVLARIVVFFGMAASPFSVILKQLMSEFNTGRGAVSFLPFISCISGAICSYYIATVMERHDRTEIYVMGYGDSLYRFVIMCGGK